MIYKDHRRCMEYAIFKIEAPSHRQRQLQLQNCNYAHYTTLFYDEEHVMYFFIAHHHPNNTYRDTATKLRYSFIIF